jgi:hypothetical protein
MKKTIILCFVFAIAGAINVNASANPIVIKTSITDSLEQYTGKYKFPDGSPVTEVNIILENGKLSASSAIGTAELKLNKGDEFEIVGYGGAAIFKRNTEGKVMRVQIIVADLDMEGTKE